VALGALGLPTQTLPDGSIAHAKPEGVNDSLAANFDRLLAQQQPPQPADDTAPPLAASTAASARPRVYGVASAPSGGADAGPASIGPLAPSGVSMAADHGGDGSDSEESPEVGPSIPPPGGGAEAAATDDNDGTGSLWWQRKQEKPTPSALVDRAGVGGAAASAEGARDGWMLSLPSDRTDIFTTGQAREFSRNGLQAKGDLEEAA
jgi:hypothetical protein